ncbi:hypothetical protein [Mycolicibacterium brisbanense]
MTAQLRQWFYLLSALASAIVPILVTLRVITENQGNQWLGLVAALGGILGTAGAGTAAVILGKQRKDGTLETAAPADAAITAIQQTVQNVTTATSELDKVKQAAADALGTVPGVGPLAAQVINAVRLP